MKNHLNPQCMPQPRFLWFLVLCYTLVMILANWFDVRLIQIFTLDTDAGTIIFPLTYLLSDLITEVYGYQQARRAIWCGFLFNLIFIAYGQIIIHLPSPDYALKTNIQFDNFLSMNVRIIMASMMSYMCAEPLNAYLMAKLKIYFSGQKLALRFIASTFFASAIDSFIFGIIAFKGTMSDKNLFSLITTMWLLKVTIEIVVLPASLYCTRKLKRLESIDIYDRNTQFTLFSLHVNYTKEDNQLCKMA